MSNQRVLKCGKRTEVYSRVSGFYRPVRFWNKGKQEEFRMRTTFIVGPSKNNRKAGNGIHLRGG